MADEISLGCHRGPDAEPLSIITDMVQERGRISQAIYQMIAGANPLIKVLEPSKEAFPSGMGDTLNEVVLDVSRPGEDAVLNWQRVGAAKPGYNPCCVEFHEVPYGSRNVSACLYRDGWRTPAFCKVDLAFKYEREKQIMQQKHIMAQWSKDIWSHWAVLAYQRSVQCVSLNGAYGLPEDLGRYPAYAPPTSILTFHHLEELYRRIRNEAGEFGRVVEGHEVIFIGDQEFAALEENYIQEQEKLGYRSSEVVLPELGSVRKLGKYMFVILDCPRRFRCVQPGETVEDALIPSTIQVETVRGTETRRNPDYENPEIAKFSEAIYFNASAAAWLVPPDAMVGASSMYPVSDYSGEFLLINPQTDKDPFQENVYFAARYMSGMIARFPKRARGILAQAVHGRYKDVCIGDQKGMPGEPEVWHVLECCEPIGANRLQLLIGTDALPAQCPDGAALFLVTKKGNKYLINSVISQEAYAGDEIHTRGGTRIEVDFPEGMEDVATCREECDAWDHVACLPANTASDAPSAGGCGSCQPGSDDCVFTTSFYTDTPLDLEDAEGNGLIGARPPGGYDAASLKAAIDSYLGATGTSEVVAGEDPENLWTVKITLTGDPPDQTKVGELTGAKVIYEDGLYEAGVELVQHGDCSAGA